MRRQSNGERVRFNTEELCRSFGEYVADFDSSPPFGGPSLYFHQRTISLRRELGSVSRAIADQRFREYLYATLAAWGLVRMGGVKMVDFSAFSESLAEVAPSLGGLAETSLDELEGSELSGVAERLCEAVGRLRITEAQAKLVANTKTIHHLLPDLVPPMDRHHIGWFFGYTPSQLQVHREPFLDMFSRLHEIARRVHPQGYVFLDKEAGWRTSRTKILDNAIVAFSLKNQPKPR